MTILLYSRPPGAFSPANLPNMAAWYRYNTGITSAGGLVSAWADQSGNTGRDLVQASGTNQPTLEADGSITFDGSDNYLKATAFTLTQPITVYGLLKQVTWANVDYIWDGNTQNSMAMIQSASGAASSPAITQFAGSWGATDLTNATLGVFHAIASVYNGASSVVQVDSNAAGTGNPGAGNGGGFTMGAAGNAAGWGNVAFKEAIIYSAAHDAATRALVISYLMSL